VLELADIVGVTFDARPARGGTAVGDPLSLVRHARLLVVATPAYKGSYTGLLKLFLDQLGPGSLTGVSALPVTVAASAAHLGAATAALHALLIELGARVPPVSVAVLEQQLTDPDRVADEWVRRHVAVQPDLYAG
jgi:FMN reductase